MIFQNYSYFIKVHAFVFYFHTNASCYRKRCIFKAGVFLVRKVKRSVLNRVISNKCVTNVFICFCYERVKEEDLVVTKFHWEMCVVIYVCYYYVIVFTLLSQSKLLLPIVTIKMLNKKRNTKLSIKETGSPMFHKWYLISSIRKHNWLGTTCNKSQ